jgi:hypothetical protein
MNIETLAAHIEELAVQHSITIIYKKNAGRSWKKTREICISPVKTAISYAVALHEIGHIVDDTRFGTLSIDREAGAWAWAKENAMEWRKPAKLAASRLIMTYIDACQGSRCNRKPIPASHPAWKFVIKK